MSREMKKSLKILFVILFIGITNACQENFLQEKVFSNLNTDGFFTNEADLQAGLIGVYDSFQGDNYYGLAVLYMADMPTEYMRGYFVPPTDNYIVTSALDPDPNRRQVSDLWQQSYKTNNLCNMVINRADKVEMDEATKTKIIAEARFLRGINRFVQVQFYGANIPLIDNETTSLKDLNVIPSNSNDLYNSIIADLGFAETNLPLVSKEGRATSWAATAYLAKVYLKMAGYSEDPSTGEMKKGDPSNYLKAKTYLDKMVNQGPFSLMPKPMDVWGGRRNETEANAEVIFAIKYATGGLGEGNSLSTCFVGKGNGWTAYTWKIISTTWEFYNSYEPQDLRRTNEMLKVSYQDKNKAWKKDDFPHCWKYVSDYDPTFSNDWLAKSGSDYGDDVVLVRYADILLMQSEVENEINGLTSGSLTGLNRVRERAGVPTYTVGDVLAMSTINKENPASGKDKLRELIIVERKKELMCEGHGWFDYVRWNILGREMTKYYEYGVFNAEANRKYNLYPIYIVDLELNNNLKQNWGW
jgi:starch-binding outer membrane protein, SusD/RagB family